MNLNFAPVVNLLNGTPISVKNAGRRIAPAISGKWLARFTLRLHRRRPRVWVKSLRRCGDAIDF